MSWEDDPAVPGRAFMRVAHDWVQPLGDLHDFGGEGENMAGLDGQQGALDSDGFPDDGEVIDLDALIEERVNIVDGHVPGVRVSQQSRNNQRQGMTDVLSGHVTRFADGKTARRPMGRRTSFGFSAAVVRAEVRFDDNRKTATTPIALLLRSVFDWMLRRFEAVEDYWTKSRRPLVVLTGLFEFWSMGIWLGFLTEPLMAHDLLSVIVIDIVCNFLYLMDNILSIGQFYLDARRKRRTVADDHTRSHQRRTEGRSNAEWRSGDARFRNNLDVRKEARRNEGSFSSTRGSFMSTVALQHRLTQALGALEDGSRRIDGANAPRESTPLHGLVLGCQHELSQAYIGLVLDIAMIPVQFELHDILQKQRYHTGEIAFVLLARVAHLWWGFRNCIALLNEQELEVYVDIKMHGTQGSSWNRARILAKQFLLIAYFGHWFGCISYGLRKLDSLIQGGMRIHPDTTRDFFEQFKEEGKIKYEPGVDFWQTYLLALYKGFNLNKKEMPERPIALLLDVVITMSLLLMKAYCIGSFFKYHQKGELEAHRFRSLMSSVQQYLDLYEVPPSLRKAVLSHFRFQQANHRKLQTLEVIGRLPIEVQKKLREQEVLPTVVDRNPSLFGNGLSRDFCLQIAVVLAPRFLEPSEVIFIESEVPRELIFLEAGAVALWRSADGERTEQLLRYVRADRKDDPTALGAVSFILGAVHFHSARVRAGAEAVTLNLPREGYEDIKMSFHDQHDQLVRNIVEAYSADGEPWTMAADENERFVASQQQEVRRTLRARQDGINTMFTFAASKGDIKLVQEVLLKRVDPNITNYDRRSALHLAAFGGMSDMLETLLEAKGDANLRDRWGSTPMQDALKNGFVTTARVLQLSGGRLELADPAALLCAYASEGNTIGMQQLIYFRVDPNAGDYDRRTALHLAASEGHLPVVTFLTMRKADVNVKDRWNSTPIQDAIHNGFATVASHLRAQGGRVDTEFVANRLCSAASTGDLPMLRMLHDTGVDVNQGDYDARTALHLAAAEGQVLALNFLVHMAQALHSPVDRWGATPLQDALSGGHTICVKLLLSCGAGLGPSADRAALQTVEELAAEMGFRNRGIGIFSEASHKLRRRIRAHMQLVEQRKARADIFDIEAAQKFDMTVVIAAFGRMDSLRAEARWLIKLLQPLALACEATQQLLRLLRDGSSIMKESRIWVQASALHAAVQNRHSAKPARRSKDAADMAFHDAFLSTTRFVPTLQKVLVATAARVLAKVKELEQSHVPKMASRYPATTVPSVSALVVAELFAELRWGGSSKSSKLREGSHFPTSAITQHAVVSRLEDTAKLLLPGEHAMWFLADGALRVRGSGVRPDGACPQVCGASASYEPLREWLQQRTRAVLPGKLVSPEPPPVLPPGTEPQEMFGCLWPTWYGGEQPPEQAAGDHLPLSRFSGHEGTNVLGRSVSEAYGVSYLVASELVFLAVIALVLEGWDRGAKTREQSVDRQRRRTAHHDRAEGEDMLAVSMSIRDILKSEQGRLTTQDFQELGGACRSAARVCRGTHHEARKLAKRILKARGSIASQRVARDVEAGERHAAQHGEEAAGEEDAENRPISLAKILALQEQLSPHELAILMDASIGASDGPTGSRGGRAFGELSRERFVMNMMRWMLDYDELQNDVVAAIESHKREAEALLEVRLFAPAEEEEEAAAEPQHLAPHHLARHRALREANNLYDEARGTESASFDSKTGPVRNAKEDEEEGPESAAAAAFATASTSERRNAFAQAADKSHESLVQPKGLWARLVGNRVSLISGMSAELSESGKRKGIQFGETASARSAGEHADGASRLRPAGRLLVLILRWAMQYLSAEGRERRKRQRIAKKFKELDDDGEGIGTADVAQVLAVAFKHSLGTEGELRWAYRVFELLNKADFGDLVTLPEMFSVLPVLTEEIRAQQRKSQSQSRRETSSDAAVGPLVRFASGLVISPESPLVHVWDMVRTIVVVYYMFEVPMHFAFLSRDHLAPWAATAHFTATIFSDIFMALNIVLTFFRAFVHPARGVVSAFQEIRIHYLLTLFPVDFLACLPVDWWLSEGSDESGLFARPSAGARLLKLLHMHHLRPQQSGHLEAVWGFTWEAWSLSLSVFVLAHLLACCWWLLGTRFDDFDWTKVYNYTDTFHPESKHRGSWLYTYPHRPGENPIGDPSGGTPYWWQYLVSYYLTIGRIVASSPAGSILPASWGELGWIISMFFLNVAVAGYCDGVLVDKVIAGDEHIIEAEAMRRILDEYLIVADLPRDLVHEVRSSAILSDKMMEWKRMEDTIATLPHSLRQRVARRTVVPRLNVQEIFLHCTESFLLELGLHCRILPVSRGHVLARPGEVCSHLIILNFGRLGVLDLIGNVLAEATATNTIIEELPFIFGLKHNIPVTALEESQLTVLPKAGFAMACKVYPEDERMLRRNAMQAVQQYSGDFGDPQKKEEDDRLDNERRGSKLDLSRTKSTLSSKTSTSQGSVANENDLNEFLRRRYLRDLKVVAEKLREEAAVARQDVIVKFIQSAADGEVSRISSMLTQGVISVDEGDSDKRTALHLAVCNGHMEIVKVLVDKFGASIQVKDRFGHTPVEDAVRERKVDILRYLMARGAHHQADANANRLCQAAYANDVEALRVLLEDVGVNPNSADYDKRTALHLGASEGHLEVCRLLANTRGIDLSPRDRLGNTPLDDAMRHKHVQVRRFLHARGARMGDRNLGVVLCSLAYADDVEGLQELADSEVSLGQGDYDARTALHLAASEDHLPTATYLLVQARVDPNPLDRFLSTPLDDAIRHKNRAMEALLRAKGGLSGSDPGMARAVEKFKEEKKLQEVQVVKRKLEKEVQSSEVSTIVASLKRFREHLTLENDIHAFITEAANFRDLLLQLLFWSSNPPEEDWTTRQVEEESGRQHQTKFYREQLLERTCVKLEGTWDRLVATLDAEVMPWLAGLSKAEARLLRVLAPDVQPAVTHTLEQLRGGVRLRKFVGHLWNEGGPGGGAYECLPVGLLTQRPHAELAHRVRLEAQALLWATGTSAGQLGSFGARGEAAPHHKDAATSSSILHVGVSL